MFVSEWYTLAKILKENLDVYSAADKRRRGLCALLKRNPFVASIAREFIHFPTSHECLVVFIFKKIQSLATIANNPLTCRG